MNQYMLIIILMFIYSVKTNSKNKYLFPNLPVGPYRVDIKAVYNNCYKEPRNYKIRFNYYLNKTSASSAVLTGNYTNEIPIDDSLYVQNDYDVKDSTGRWQENIITFSRPKACSLTLAVTKKKYWRDFGYSGTCPEPVGVHIVPGSNASNIQDLYVDYDFPKTFFYGTYRTRVTITDKNKNIFGCFIVVVEVKRPWESY